MTDQQRSSEMEEVEREVRAMLHRRSTDVTPDRPAWDSLTFAEPRPISSTTGREWARPLAAAASVAVLLAVGALVLSQTSDGSDQPEAALATDGGQRSSTAPDEPDQVTPAPGTVEFNRATAHPVYPVRDEAELGNLPPEELRLLEEDPVTVARAYLAEVAIETDVGSVEDLEVGIADPAMDPVTGDGEDARNENGSGNGRDDEAARAEEEATGADEVENDLGPEVSVAWSTWADTRPAISSGHVYLRRTAVVDEDNTEREPWIVVGSRTEGIQLQSVHRDDERLQFTVRRVSRPAEPERVRVEVDGDPVAVDLPPDSALPVDLEVEEDGVAVIRIQHLDPAQEGEDRPVSIAEVAVPHPETVEHDASVAR